MNNTYYQNPMFPNTGTNNNYEDIRNNQNIMYNIPNDNFIDTIIRFNKGKMATFHVTIPGSIEWQDKTFEGLIESSGKDHIIVSNSNTGQWHVIPLIYLDFITFEEPVNYQNNS